MGLPQVRFIHPSKSRHVLTQGAGWAKFSFWSAAVFYLQYQ